MSRHVKWALQNLPSLAFRKRQYVEDLVQLALDQTGMIRMYVTLSIFVAGLWMSWELPRYLTRNAVSRFEAVLIMALAGLAASFLGKTLGDVILRRRMRKLVDDT